MSSTPKVTFKRKAPLIDIGELASVLEVEILTTEMLNRAKDAWVIGSFANPTKSIGTTEEDWSDLDIFVRIPEWSLPQAETGIALSAEAASIPSFIDRNHDGEWAGVKGPERWNCTVDTAWSRLPTYAQECLLRSCRKVVFRSEAEKRERRPRYIDLFIGNGEQLRYQRNLGTDSDELPGFLLWENERFRS